MLNSTGSVEKLNGETLGNYEFHSKSNGKNVYKMIEDSNYLHFNPMNQWMVRHFLYIFRDSKVNIIQNDAGSYDKICKDDICYRCLHVIKT